MPLYRARAADHTDSIQAGLSALAKAFGPQSASEAYAGAKAVAERESASRLAAAYAAASDPNITQDQRDRLNIGAGLYNPTQSYHNIGVTDRRSGLNNAADNSRALQQTVLQQQGETDRTMLAPVAQGATRFVPKRLAEAYGTEPTQVGVVELNQGQQATLPDGRVLAGAPKPLSVDELRAQDAQTLPVNDPLRRALMFGSTPTANIQTPEGTRVMTMPEALNKAPAEDNKNAQLLRYETKDGRQGVARYDNSRRMLVDAQEGFPLPGDGLKTFTTQVQGSQEETGVGLANASQKLIEQRLLDASAVENAANQIDAILARTPGALGLSGSLRGALQNSIAATDDVLKAFAPQHQRALDEIKTGAIEPGAAAYFNPDIPKAELAENLLVYSLAKMNDPGGNITIKGIEETRRALGATGLTGNTQQRKAALDQIRTNVANTRQMYGKLAPTAAGVTAPAIGNPPAGAPAPEAPPVGTTTPNAPASAPKARLRYNMQTGEFE